MTDRLHVHYTAVRPKPTNQRTRPLKRCRFCGIPIYWRDCTLVDPTDPLGRSHLEQCAGLPRHYQRKMQDRNHEEAVARFLASVPAAPTRKAKRR